MKRPWRFLPYSHSKIALHKHCPKKFQFRHIDKLPFIPTIHTEKGKIFHSFFEQWLNGKGTNEVCINGFDRFVVDRPLLDQYIRQCHRIIQTDWFQWLKKQSPIQEQRFMLDRYFNATHNKEDTIVKGFIDSHFIAGDICHVFDFKTGKYIEEHWQDYDQLKLYAIWLFQKYQNVSLIRATYVYVTASNKTNTITIHRSMLGELKRQVADSIIKIEHDETFVKKEQILCQWCEYKVECAKSVSNFTEEVEKIDFLA